MAISDLTLPANVLGFGLDNGTQLAGELAVTVADALRSAIAERGVASLVVSGGRSPVPFFERLAQQELDWTRVAVSLADERWVPVKHSDSNEGLVRNHLLCGPAAKASFMGLYQAAPSLEEAAQLADRKLAELPMPIDVLVLGMGEDGHTASLFPGSPNLEQALNPDNEARCLPMQAPNFPRQRLTLPVSVLGNARLTVLSLQGKDKLDTLQRALSGKGDEHMPIRVFLRRPLEIYWCP